VLPALGEEVDSGSEACVENMTVDSLLEEIAIKMSTRSFKNIKKSG
jgi:hypothetical protein